MKYLEGETLDAYVLRKTAQSETLPLNQVVALLSRAAVALDYAHQNGVIHRDIKPSNIFLVKSGGKLHVQIIDFGLADEIRTSMTRVSQARVEVSGTRPYRSPEQWRGRTQSAATDQYALAVVAYELLAGHVPFKNSDVALLRLAVMNDLPEPIPTISDSANAVLRKALSKDAADRFATCRDFIAALNEKWTTGGEDEEEEEEEEEESVPFALSEVPRWGWALAGCMLAAVLLGVLVWGTGNRNKPVPLPAETSTVAPAQERGANAAPLATSQTTATPRAAQTTQTQRQAGDRMTLTIKGVEYAFRRCPPGTFMMGSPPNEANRRDNERQHEVILTRGFWMLETEVTQEMWRSVMGNNPSRFRGDKRPVETVSWHDCQEFITKLNDEIASGGHKSLVSNGGLTPAAHKFSLPTEAQWEYACRAGTTTAYHFGNSLSAEQAHIGHTSGSTRDVGSYPANAWGLRDMHGNVWERCQDWYGDYPSGAVTDPVGSLQGTRRVVRGGGWSDVVWDCRSARRNGAPLDLSHEFLGFRLALVPEATVPPPPPKDYRSSAGLTVYANHNPGLQRSAGSNNVHISGTQYNRGLFCHARSHVAVVLDKPGKTFTAVVGIDSNPDTRGGKGSVRFVVTLDGETKFRSAILREGSPPVDVRVDLAGSREFSLIIEDGGDGISHDQSNWALAKVEYADGTEQYLDEFPFHVTTIFYAAGYGTADDVRYFQSSGSRVNQRDSHGKTPLHYAAIHNSDVEVAKYLVSQGADIHAKTVGGGTPLFYAAEYNSNVEVVKHLISQGADVNAKNNAGDTPLHMAAGRRNVDVVKYLVDQGADVNAKSNNASTPLHRAARDHPNIDVLKYLISQGADINAKDNDGRAPLDVADTEEKKAIIRAAGGVSGTVTPAATTSRTTVTPSQPTRASTTSSGASVQRITLPPGGSTQAAVDAAVQRALSTVPEVQHGDARVEVRVIDRRR